jgi:anti-sigma factor RsiW
MDRRNRNNVTDSKEQEAVMVRYLLGQSPEKERDEVEERYFSDGGYFDRLLALEDSLIDDFVSGRMPAEQLDAFRESLSVRQDDVRFTRALVQAVTKKKSDQPAPDHALRLPAPQRTRFAQTRSFLLAASIAALIVLAIGLALLWRYQTLKNSLFEVETNLVRLKGEKEAAERDLAQARSQRESSAQEVEIERNKRIDAESSLQKQGRPESPNVSSDFRTIVLGSVFIPRGATGAIKEVRVSENARWLRLVVPVEGYGKYQSHRISMKRAGEGELFDSESLKPPGGSRKLAFTVPATNLRPGDYIVTLYGERPAAARTELEQYSFRITS